MNNIYLHGELGEKYGKEHHFKVGNINQLIAYLTSVNTMVRQDIMEGNFRIVVGDIAITDQMVEFPFGDGDDIHVTPVIEGDKSEIGTILIGAALIAGAFVSGGATLAGLAALGPLGTIALNTGAALVLSGVSQLIAPTPDEPIVDNRQEFSGTQNVAVQGGTIPVVYGTTRIGSTVISTGITNEEPRLYTS